MCYIRAITREEVTEMIYNVPEYAKEYEYLVVRYVDGEAWFWGAYHTRQDAERAAAYLGDDEGAEVVEAWE
jgi:hypothetical protein